MKLILPIVALIVAWKAFKILMGYETMYWNGFSAILQGMRPGINEEAGFRGVAVALAFRKYRRPGKISGFLQFLSALFLG